MSDDTDVDLAALREQTSHGDRLDDAADETATTPFTETIATELAAIDDGETHKTVSVWDGQLAAFLNALEEHPDEMTAVGTALQTALDISPDETVDRSELIRLALRLGFSEAAPDHVQALRQAIQQQATSQF